MHAKQDVADCKTLSKRKDCISFKHLPARGIAPPTLAKLRNILLALINEAIRKDGQKLMQQKAMVTHTPSEAIRRTKGGCEGKVGKILKYAFHIRNLHQ
jgi:glutamyl/glutaminyl-tRNA synthetase